MRTLISKTLLMSSLIFVISCGSTKKNDTKDIARVEHSDTIKKDYLVTDSSHQARPIWVVDAQGWADDNDRDIDKYRYFAFETDAKAERELACEEAKAKARSDIASEITTFIQYNLSSSKEGDSHIDQNHPKVQKIRHYVESTLTSKVQAMIHGAAVLKLYWEKRDYKKDLGAKKDFYGFTCSALLRMKNEDLTEAITKAKEGILEQADDVSIKEKVKKSLEKIEVDFINARKGKA